MVEKIFLLMKIAILGGTESSDWALPSDSAAQVMRLLSDRAMQVKRARPRKPQALRSRRDKRRSRRLVRQCVRLSVPYASHRSLLEPLRGQLRGKIIIDATVPIDPANLLQIKTESGRRLQKKPRQS